MSETATETLPAEDRAADKAQAGKYLTFHLAGEVYGLEILKVEEIMGMMDVTHVPQMPAFIRGVINLRGRVIPVLDLRLKFGLESQENTMKTCIIVVELGIGTDRMIMGVIVDEVAEVLEIASDQIAPAPEFGSNVNTDFILGMGKIGQKVVMLLDADKVLTETDDIATAIRSSQAETSGETQEQEQAPQQDQAEQTEQPEQAPTQ